MVPKETLPPPAYDIKQIEILGQPTSIEIAHEGSKIPIRDRLDDPDYKGPWEFDTVVNFSDLFVSRGMMNQHVHPSEQWSANNPPPDGIEILEFSDNYVAEVIREISEIAAEEFYHDKEKCKLYKKLNGQVFRAITKKSDVDITDVPFAGLYRAGVVAGEMLSITYKYQVVIQTKRLHLKGEGGGNIAVGITYKDPDQMKEFDGERILIADPAGATFSSVIGNLVYLVLKDIRPKKVSVWNTVVSQRGALFALEAMEEMGIEGEIVAGGYSPGMNERYYLETKDKTPSVRDAGDGLAMFIPEELR